MEAEQEPPRAAADVEDRVVQAGASSAEPLEAAVAAAREEPGEEVGPQMQT